MIIDRIAAVDDRVLNARRNIGEGASVSTVMTSSPAARAEGLVKTVPRIAIAAVAANKFFISDPPI
jgi:hypothetical protein